MDIPSYLLGAIKGAKSAGVKYVVVQELPSIGEEGTIYLVPKTTAQTDNVYDEYMYINSAWELIGDTEIDLSDYLKEEDLKTINGQSLVGSGDLEVGVNTIIFEDNPSYDSQQNIDTTANRELAQIVVDNWEKINDYNIVLRRKVGSNPAKDLKLLYLEKTPYSSNYDMYKLYFHEKQRNTASNYGVSYTYDKYYLFTINYVNESVNFIGGAVDGPYFELTENNKLLGTTNTSSYTPTGDYNPATKKYVDDSIASAIGTALQENY